MRPQSLKARAFIREAADVIWTLGTTARLTKEEDGGKATGRVGVVATKAWKARSGFGEAPPSEDPEKWRPCSQA